MEKKETVKSLTKIADELIAKGGAFDTICAELAKIAKARKIKTATDRKYVLGIIKWRKKYQPAYAHYYDALEITENALVWSTPPQPVTKTKTETADAEK